MPPARTDPPGDYPDYDPQIEPEPLEQPDFTTIVRGSGAPETSSSAWIGARDLSLLRGRSAADGLRLVPGLALVHHGGEGKGPLFFLRGFDAQHGASLEVTVDGIPMNAPSHIHGNGYVDLGFLMPEVVARIDVMKGPFASFQGPFAVAGTAGLRLGVTREQRGVGVEYEIGSTNRHRLRTLYVPDERTESGAPSPIHEPRTFVGMELLYDDGFGENRRSERVGFIGALNLFDDGRGRLDLTAAASVSAFRQASPIRLADVGLRPLTLYDAEDPETRGEASRLLLGVDWSQRHGDHDFRVTGWATGTYLELLENATGALLDPLNGDRRRQRDQALDLGVNGQHSWRVSPRFDFQTGAGIRSVLTRQGERHVGRDLEPLDERRSLSGSTTSLHALLAARWTPVDSLRMDVAVRGDFTVVDASDHLAGVRDSGGAAAVSPRLALSWYPAAELGVFAAYGRGTRSPELRAFAGEPSLTTAMMASDTVEAGIRTAPLSWLRVDVSAFFTAVEDDSRFDAAVGTTTQLSATRRYGAEVDIVLAPVDWLELRADVAYVDARQVDSGALLPGVPAWMGSATASVDLPVGLRVGLRFLGMAPRPISPGVESAPYTSLDLHALYAWRRFRFGLHIENLLGLELQEGHFSYASQWDQTTAPSDAAVTHAVPGPPFTARLTLGIDF